MTAAPSRARAMLAARAKASHDKRERVLTAVQALEAAGRQLAAERDARAAEASHAQRRVRELEDELTAARESLRRAIRHANR